MRYNLKVGVVGTGFMGKTHLEALSSLVEELVICSTDEKSAKALSEKYSCNFYTDYIEMLDKENPDFISVCLPTKLHYAVSMAAMERGINVLCEKPFASSVEEASEMVRVAEEKGLTLMVAHCLRFTRAYEFLRRCVRDERYGKLVSFNAYRDSERPGWSVGNWLSDAALSGGVIKDLGIHNTDMVVSLFGIPGSVYTVGTPSVAHTVYGYDSDTVITSAISWRDIKDLPYENGYDAVFERAVLKNNAGELTVYTDSQKGTIPEDEEFSEDFSQDMYANEINYYCKCLVYKKPTEICPVSESLAALKVNFMEFEKMNAGKK